MKNTQKEFTDRLENIMLNSFEPMTEEQALDEARCEGLLQNDLTVDHALAALARAKFTVLGELIANEYETPDSERMLDEGFTRERAIKNFMELFTK